MVSSIAHHTSKQFQSFGLVQDNILDAPKWARSERSKKKAYDNNTEIKWNCAIADQSWWADAVAHSQSIKCYARRNSLCYLLSLFYLSYFFKPNKLNRGKTHFYQFPSGNFLRARLNYLFKLYQTRIDLSTSKADWFSVAHSSIACGRWRHFDVVISMHVDLTSAWLILI